MSDWERSQEYYSTSFPVCQIANCDCEAEGQLGMNGAVGEDSRLTKELVWPGSAAALSDTLH
jgi:hypothetical protein